MGNSVTASAEIVVEGRDALTRRFDRVRSLSMALAHDLSDADATAQSMPDASPAKWHLAHTTWFFETFVLADHVPGYRSFDARFPYLFNSYYEAKGARIGRATRGLITRPSLAETVTYRQHIDEAVRHNIGAMSPEVLELISLGCHHEEQHQELLLTDLLHLFAQNPLAPALWPATITESISPKTGVRFSEKTNANSRRSSTLPDTIFGTALGPADPPADLHWIEGKQGPVSIGHEGTGFAFDCEGPRHTTWLAPHALADRLVTNGEWMSFIKDDGYTTAGNWLSDGWAWVRQNAIEAPLHWRRDDDETWAYQFGLDGLTPLNPGAPVQHVSFYEADAYARWAGARLPTEAEWESAAQAFDDRQGNFLDHPGRVTSLAAEGVRGLKQMYGALWQWTGSAFLPYPGFRAAAGAVGEYNGKFMSGQFVLRGGSCATPRGHVRASYRNFFYPHQRWQFTGVRLARDL